MGRISTPGKSCALQAACHDLLHAAGGQPFASSFGDKYRIFIHQIGQGGPDRKIVIQRVLTGIVQINQPLLVAFAGDADGIVPEIAHIHSDQLRKTHAAIQEKDQNTEVPLIEITLYIF